MKGIDSGTSGFSGAGASAIESLLDQSYDGRRWRPLGRIKAVVEFVAAPPLGHRATRVLKKRPKRSKE